MTVSYRDKFSNYMNDANGQHAPVGLIFPVLVDLNSNPEGDNRSPEYSYKGYLYCDGRTLNIRDYPALFNVVRNTYGGATQVTKTQSSQAGGIRRYYWVNNKPFINLYRDSSINSDTKFPYPYGVTFRFVNSGNGLGSLPSSTFDFNVFYGTKAPTEDVTSYLPGDNTEFAYEVVFPSTVDVSSLTQDDINVTSGTHPNVIFNKTFNINDYPYNVGTFKLPDYRDRMIVGYGPVDGQGSSTVENALVNAVGQTGGRWFISKDDLLDAGTFFSVGDVKTRGYANITGDILTYVSGSVEYTIGPLDDYIFSRPIEHYHYILSSEPDESFESEFSGIAVDQYAVLYSKSRANIIPFEPDTSDGLALGHSHGLSAEVLNDSKLSTYGNVGGIGGIDPTEAPAVDYDVNDPFLTASVQYSGTALIPYGSGTGETNGFAAPQVSNKGDKYVAFGTPLTTPFSSLQSTRTVSYEVDLTNYEKIYILAIMGNDDNGGERVNNAGEGLYLVWPDNSQSRLLPSREDFTTDTGGNFQAYDAAYAYWRQSEVDIPTQYRTANVRFTLKQTVVSTTGVGGTGDELQAPSGNPNAYDMIGIQAIGFREGIPDELPQDSGIYPVTGSPSITLSSLTYDSANSRAVANTSTAHTFEAGDYITVAGASPTGFNGTFQVLDNDLLTGTSFSYTPTDTSNLAATATGLPIVKLASGIFSETTTTPNPRVYVVNDATVIGGKTQIFDIPGTGTTFQTQTLASSGTINMSPVAASTGTTTNISINLVAPGGGGADSNTDGGNAGYAYVTFPFKGTNYTVYAYGGKGGKSGNNGGAGGDGGSFLIPTALINDPDFEYSTSSGTDGQDGGGTGSDSASTNGGGTDGSYGTGGDGKSTSFTTTQNDPETTYTTSGSWTAPATSAGEISRTITVKAAGGGGGGGNANANSGCQAGSTQSPFGDGSAKGGSGNGGAEVTAVLTRSPSSLTFAIGGGGNAGFNNRDGYVNGTGSESGPSSGGSGAADGGLGATGAWGNGATGGGGGGATGVYFDGGTAIIGAAGGGGGGGSGGGYNGGGTVDGCYAGGSAQSADTNLHSQSSALDFNDGGNGTSGGCSAGGGGGGGGGAGPVGSSNGGDAGQAGIGHNGNGGGTGGKRGDSAYRSDYVTASWASASNGGGPGSSGGSGYVKISVTRSILNYGAVGGAGGQGGSVNMTIRGADNCNISLVAGLQSPGSGGGNGTGGTNGYVEVRYSGSSGGGQTEGDPTEANGQYYNGSSTGVPGGSSFDGDIWTSSSNDDMIAVTPGLGSGSSGRFSMPSGSGIPTYNGLVTKYLPFTGSGTREYVVGTFDFTLVNKIRFIMIRGNNQNGGATPEEDVIAYWKVSGSSTTNLLDTVITSSETATGWGEYDIELPAGDNIRTNNVELILRQTRNAGQDDNNTAGEDNYGLAAITLFFDEQTSTVFTPASGGTIENVDAVTKNVSALQAGISSTDGFFEMSSSTPISTTALVSPEKDIPLITRYHRVKYLIKAI